MRARGLTRRGLIGGAGAALATPADAITEAVRQVVMGGAASLGPTAEELQFYNRLSTVPTAARQAQYAALINGLVADGVWSLLDVLVVAGSNPAFLVNLKQNSFAPSVSGSCTLVEDRYINGSTGGPSYVETSFNPSTAGGNYTQNSASIGVFNLDATQYNARLISTTADVSVEIWPKYNTGITYYSVNGAESASAVGAAADASGFFIASRTAASGAGSTVIYRNASQIASASTTSVAPENLNLRLLLGGACPNWKVAAYFIGGGLDATKAAAIDARVRTYLTAIGAI